MNPDVDQLSPAKRIYSLESMPRTRPVKTRLESKPRTRPIKTRLESKSRPDQVKTRLAASKRTHPLRSRALKSNKLRLLTSAKSKHRNKRKDIIVKVGKSPCADICRVCKTIQTDILRHMRKSHPEEWALRQYG